MRSIRRIKETISVDTMEFTHAGGNRSGLVFYGINSKLVAYHGLGYKESTTRSNLYDLVQFMYEQGIPRQLVMDSHSILGTGNLWKRVLGMTFTPLFLSEPYKHNQNLVGKSIQGIQSGVSKIMNACGVGVMAYKCDMWEYICDVNKYVAWDSLDNSLPYEVFWGETPDISIICFKFW